MQNFNAYIVNPVTRPLTRLEEAAEQVLKAEPLADRVRCSHVWRDGFRELAVIAFTAAVHAETGKPVQRTDKKVYKAFIDACKGLCEAYSSDLHWTRGGFINFLNDSEDENVDLAAVQQEINNAEDVESALQAVDAMTAPAAEPVEQDAPAQDAQDEDSDSVEQDAPAQDAQDADSELPPARQILENEGLDVVRGVDGLYTVIAVPTEQDDPAQDAPSEDEGASTYDWDADDLICEADLMENELSAAIEQVLEQSSSEELIENALEVLLEGENELDRCTDVYSGRQGAVMAIWDSYLSHYGYSVAGYSLRDLWTNKHTAGRVALYKTYIEDVPSEKQFSVFKLHTQRLIEGMQNWIHGCSAGFMREGRLVLTTDYYEQHINKLAMDCTQEPQLTRLQLATGLVILQYLSRDSEVTPLDAHYSEDLKELYASGKVKELVTCLAGLGIEGYTRFSTGVDGFCKKTDVLSYSKGVFKIRKSYRPEFLADLAMQVRNELRFAASHERTADLYNLINVVECDLNMLIADEKLKAARQAAVESEELAIADDGASSVSPETLEKKGVHGIELRCYQIESEGMEVDDSTSFYSLDLSKGLHGTYSNQLQRSIFKRRECKCTALVAVVYGKGGVILYTDKTKHVSKSSALFRRLAKHIRARRTIPYNKR